MLLAGALAFLSVASGAPQPPTQRAALSRQLHALVKPSLGPPGAILFVRDARRMWSVTAGRARLQPPLAIKATDRYRINSVTKTFVAALALRLVEQGKLQLGDTVQKWLPSLLPADKGSRITIRQLLNHTSGLSNLEGSVPSLDAKLERDLAHVFPPEELIGLAAARPLDFKPGSSWAYSNTGYLVLGRIIEKASGQPLGVALDRQLFTPLGLKSTSFNPGPTIRGRFAHGYALPGALPGIPKKGRFDASAVTTGAWAAGAIVSTTRDVATFYSALLGGRVLDPALLKTMRSTVSAYYPYYPTEKAGLGIMRFEVNCAGSQRRAWGHLGGNPAYGDVVLTNGDGTKVVVLMVNAGISPDDYLPIADSAFCA